MPKVRVSAVRFGSMLANRNLIAADVAHRIKTEVDLAALVNVDTDIAFDDVATLAKFFKRPWSYLLIDEAERYNSGNDNRTFANQRLGLSPDLLAELQATDFMLEAASELFPTSTFSVPHLDGQITAARLATEMRSFLNVDYQVQLESKDGFAALRLWVGAVHAQGVYVAQRRLHDVSIRAFSKVLNAQAAIVVDTGDTAYARIFSVLHEYCHVTLRTTGICDLDDHSDTERFCNAVAAGVLLPSDLVDQVVKRAALHGSADSVDDALKAFSNRLHVSQAVLLIRLRDLGIIDQDSYDGMELRRSARRSGGKRSGGQYYAPAINRVGRLYAHRVIDALSEGAIDRQSASALLGVGEHLMPTYVSKLSKADWG